MSRPSGLKRRRALAALAAVSIAAVPCRAPLAAPMAFVNASAEAGITHLHYHMDGADSLGEPSWMSGAAVAEDFDGDGYLDLYVQQGGALENLLYMNDKAGGFVDEAAQRNANLKINGMGASAADFDNDGDRDLLLMVRSDEPLLLENLGDGTFADPIPIPVPGALISQMCSSWGDVDNDGALELVVGQWATQKVNFWAFHLRDGAYVPYEFRENPFSERRVYSPRFVDFNNDRLVDLPVVADFSNSQLYISNDGATFRRTTANSNACTDQNGMGSAIGDFDNDGDLDWFVTSIYDLSGTVEGNWGISGNRLYRNRGAGTFDDVTTSMGVRDGNWGWGASFGDLDLDGDLDIYHVNGWTDSRPEVGVKFNNKPARLFENRPGQAFAEVAAASGAADTGQGRGMILFDYDNDGDLDIHVCNNQILSFGAGGAATRDPAPSVLYRNETVRDGRGWLKALLAGNAPKYHRDGVGSRVYVSTPDGVSQLRELHASTNFMSQEPGRVAHFGLGLNAVATEVVAEWSLGDAVLLENVAPNQQIVIPSPTADVDKRLAVEGEKVTALGALVEPLEAPREWIIEGKVHAQGDVEVAFATAGPKTLRLNLYEPDGTTLLRAELVRMAVAPGPPSIPSGFSAR